MLEDTTIINSREKVLDNDHELANNNGLKLLIGFIRHMTKLSRIPPATEF